MKSAPHMSLLRTTVLTIGIGAIGAAIASVLGAPLAPLVGPAVLVSIATVAGLKAQIDDRVRDAAFMMAGIGIGSTIDDQAGAAFLRWPVAFMVLATLVYVIIFAGRMILQRGFRFDATAGTLAVSPGNLSFVLAMSTEHGNDMLRVSVVQSVRLLAMVVAVPFALMALGVDVSGGLVRSGVLLTWVEVAILVTAALMVGYLAKRVKLPAPMLISGLAVSAPAHLTGLMPGVLHPWLAATGFIVIGALVGTRFSGISWRALKSALTAGLVTTISAMMLSVAAAYPVAIYLGMPFAHVLVGFAPGGIEAMLAIGNILGADPGFVAAAHVFRLLVLSVLLPILLGPLAKKVAGKT